MKLSHLLLTGACALAFAGMASAQTVLTITGSSAYRGPVHKAIVKLLGGTVDTSGATPTATVPTAGGNGGFAYANASDFTKGNGAIFRGYLNGNAAQEVIIYTSWTGSAAGLQTVASTASSFTVRTLPAATTLSTTGHAGLADPTNAANPADTRVPDVAMSDNKQSSTAFNGTFNGEAYTDLTATRVGVVPFVFVRSKGAPSSIANMTPQIARSLWTGSGKIPLSFFSGLSSDATTFVYATGRDGDSGTRIDAFAETGIGITSGVQQYDCSTEALYPAQTINGIDYEAGQGGESSGGNLANTSHMGKTGLVKYYVGYMSTGDAKDLTTNAGGSNLSQALAYNGVSYNSTADDVKIQQGSYTFWGFEYLNYKPSLSGLKKTTADAVATQIHDVDAAILLSGMKVTRGTDGGKVIVGLP